MARSLRTSKWGSPPVQAANLCIVQMPPKKLPVVAGLASLMLLVVSREQRRWAKLDEKYKKEHAGAQGVLCAFVGLVLDDCSVYQVSKDCEGGSLSHAPKAHKESHKESHKKSRKETHKRSHKETHKRSHKKTHKETHKESDPDIFRLHLKSGSYIAIEDSGDLFRKFAPWIQARTSSHAALQQGYLEGRCDVLGAGWHHMLVGRTGTKTWFQRERTPWRSEAFGKDLHSVLYPFANPHHTVSHLLDFVYYNATRRNVAGLLLTSPNTEKCPVVCHRKG